MTMILLAVGLTIIASAATGKVVRCRLSFWAGSACRAGKAWGQTEKTVARQIDDDHYGHLRYSPQDGRMRINGRCHGKGGRIMSTQNEERANAIKQPTPHRKVTH
jgi:hypothetical protein